MKFNIKKYEHRKFHADEKIDKKIKALYLWFDYEVERRKLSYPNQLTLIDSWIRSFELHELYEVIPMFKLRRGQIVRLIARGKTVKMVTKKAITPKRKKKVTKVKRKLGLKDRVFNVINSIKSLFSKK